MKKFFIAVLALLLSTGIVYASEGYDFKGSHTGYDVNAEMAVLNKVESQTDPATEKVMLDGMALKFEFFSNNFAEIDGYQVASVHFSDKKDKYIYDYYVDVDKVVKIVLLTKNGTLINKQVYPEKKGATSDSKK